MEEETTMQNETEELTAETLAALDEGWDDEEEPGAYDDRAGGEDESEEPDTGSGSEETEADADQQEADGDEGGEEEPSQESEGEGDKGDSDRNEFVLKHLGEEKAVGRDEVIVLAQKGMDYDRIREKWDSVKDDIDRLRGYESFLTELAKGKEGGIDALIDETRTRALIARAKAEGRELDPAAAAAQAVGARMSAAQKAASDEAAAEAQRKERQDAAVQRFRDVYPEVSALDIPKEVWDEANLLDDLLGPYQKWEQEKLAKENKRLKEELDAAKQQQKNKERSTGSPRSVGSAAAKDDFDEGWDSDL